MAAKPLKSATFKSKNDSKLPAGAKILNNEIRIEVEEIENGYIIEKRQDIKFSVGGNVDWKYLVEKHYSKDNPLKIETEEKSLADLLG